MTTVLVACPLLSRVGGCEQWGEGEEGDGVAWTDFCNNRDIIVSYYWLSLKHRIIISPDGLEKKSH